MFRSQLKIAFRNLWKRRAFAATNIFGLTLGLTVFLLILQYTHFEWSYDQYHENKDHLYRITLEQFQNNELVHASAENYPALGPALKDEFPEILDYTRLYNLGAKNNVAVTREDTADKIVFKHRRLLYASESFLSMFSYELVVGNPIDALSQPFKMVISEAFAEKYFGEEEAIGKHLRMQDDDFNNELCEITGVVKVPANSHLKFDVLISYATLFSRYDGSERARARYDLSWNRKDMYTYVQLAPDADPARIEARFPDLIDRYIPDLAGQNRNEILHMQPITQIHLYSNLNDEPGQNGNGRSVYFMSLIAVFVLFIGYINYINLSTAQSVERANEVGVRKVLGAMPHQLIKQFLVESLILNLMAVALAAAIFMILFPAFAELTSIFSDGEYWDYLLIKRSWFYLLLLALILGGSILSGLYPAFVLSNFKPVRTLGQTMKASSGGVLFRKALVVFQFGICICLIIGTLVVYQQMHFMQNQDLGFNPNQIVVVEQPSVFSDFEGRTNSIRTFKTALAQAPGITDVMSTLVIPGQKIRWRFNIHRQGQEEDQSHVFNYNIVDEQFFPGFEMDIVAGRNFSAAIPSDRDTACIITELGAKRLGFESPAHAIGQVIKGEGLSAIVVGVVNDYHQESFHEEVQPTIFFLNDYAEYYLMRVATSHVSTGIALIEDKWNEQFPGSPFHYFFMDDHFNAQYQNDLRFQRLFMVFAILAIVVACMGLFGLSAYMARQRLREIGIRKVLGARVYQIILLLTSDFTRLILLANIIAWPIIGLMMQRWLDGFVNRISLNLWSFLLCGSVVLAIGIFTVSYHALRAASSNPSRVLSTE